VNHEFSQLIGAILPGCVEFDSGSVRLHETDIVIYSVFTLDNTPTIARCPHHGWSKWATLSFPYSHDLRRLGEREKGVPEGPQFDYPKPP